MAKTTGYESLSPNFLTLLLSSPNGEPADSPESSCPDGAKPASREEGGASGGEHKEDERLDSEALIDAADRGELARVKEIIAGMKTNGVSINHQGKYGYTALM